MDVLLSDKVVALHDLHVVKKLFVFLGTKVSDPSV